MSNRMHEMRLAESDSCIQIQGVIDFARRFGDGKGSCVSEFIVGTDDKGIKCVFWVQVGPFHDLI